MAGFTLKLKIEGGQQIVSRANGRAIEKAGRAMIDVATLIALSEAKQKAPVRHNILRGSITRSLLGPFEGTIGTNVEYAKYQEFGTGIYGPKKQMITPKRGRFLVFKGGTGKMIFARQVRGSKPHHFMKKGLLAVQTQLNYIKRIGADAVKDYTGL